MRKREDEGVYYDDLEVGDVYSHVGRTVTETDNTWFTLLTLNTQPLHFNQAFAKKTHFGRAVVNGFFTLALVAGMSVKDLSYRNLVANVGIDEVKFPAPVFPGDTIDAESEILEKRPSRSRQGEGIVTVKSTGINQDGKVVIEFKRTFIMKMRKPQKSG